MGNNVALAGIIGQRETAIIGAVVDEITVKPAEQYFLSLLPPVSRPEHLVYHEKVSGFGGLIAERTLGEEGKNGDASSSEVFEYSPGAYQESVRFGERDLITLRRLGSIGERGATGVTKGALDFLTRAGQNLEVKLNNRLNQLACDAMFSGTYQYRGQTKFDFAKPAGNTVQTATDWSNADTSTPFKDLYTIFSLNSTYYKYIVKELVVNPITAAAMLMSKEAQVVITNNANAVGDINKIREILYPLLPPIKVVKDAYQDQSTVGGKIVNGAAKYFQPDYKILAVVDMGGTLYGQYGEIQMTYNLNDPTATIERPAIGVYTFLDEEGLRNKKAPWVDVTAGFNGGPNLMRSNDVLVINTKAGI